VNVYADSWGQNLLANFRENQVGRLQKPPPDCDGWDVPETPTWKPTPESSFRCGPYYPTLLVVPGNAVSVWLTEIKTHFPDINVMYMSATSKTTKSTEGVLDGITLVKNMKDLHAEVARMNFTDPSTCLNIVLVTYQV
jgi:hypothetical protein